jgi:hypothetical protein
MNANNTFLDVNPEHTEVGASAAYRPAVTLIEASFFLMIAISVIAGVMYMAKGTIAQNNSVQELQTLNNLAAAIQQIKTSQGFPLSAAIGTTLNTLGLVPPNIQQSNGSNFINSWGGAITFTQENSGAGFTINYTGVPTGDCKLLVNALKPGLLSSFGSGTYTMSLSTMTAAEVAVACAAGTPSFSTVVVP